MTREIKFRAFWKDANMVADVVEMGDGYVVIIVPVVSSIPGHTHERQELEDDQYELLQYTGLKDKNGREIYEGDIIQVFYHDMPQIAENKAYTVVINDMMEDRFTGVGSGLGEVIGNIYENPELLK